VAELIRVETSDGIARVHLQTGPGNPLTLEALRQMRKIVVRLGDRPPDLVVLTAEGDDFSIGLPSQRDEPLYDAFEKLIPQRDAFRAQELIKRLRSSIDAWGRLPCPIVAVVRGRCEGAGLALALAADFRVGAEDASLSVPDVQRGLISGLGTLSRLAVLLGTSRTMTAVLTRASWTGTQAHQLGLFTRVTPVRDVDAAAEVLVAELMDTPSHTRQQGLLTLRTLQDGLVRATIEAETEAAARTWIRGEWVEHLS